jgi:transposase-like protein
MSVRQTLLLKRREEVRAALQATGSVPKAARLLGVGERTLWNWLRQDPLAREGVRLPEARTPTKP